MAVLPVTGWKARLDQLRPDINFEPAITEFARAIGELTDQLNVAGGTASVITFNQPIFKTNLMTLAPTMSYTSWAIIIANAWFLAMNAAAITPSTVTDPTWIGSGFKDTITHTTGASVIQNLSSAKTLLEAELIATMAEHNSTLDFSKAFRDATLMLMFQVIGLGPAPIFPPIPLIKGVE